MYSRFVLFCIMEQAYSFFLCSWFVRGSIARIRKKRICSASSCNEKWEKIRQVRAEAGRKGGAKKGNQNATKQKQTKTSKNKQTIAKQAVTVTDTVTGTVTVPVTNKPPDGTAPDGAAPPASSMQPARK